MWKPANRRNGGLKPHVILGPSDSKKVPSIQPPFHLMSQLTTAHVCFLKSCWAVVEDMKDGRWGAIINTLILVPLVRDYELNR